MRLDGRLRRTQREEADHREEQHRGGDAPASARPARRRRLRSSSLLSMPRHTAVGGVTVLQRRFQAREPLFPGVHHRHHLRRHQPALEVPARAAAQRAEHVFRRQAVDQLAIARSSCRSASRADRHSLRADQSPADPALDAAQRVRREPRDFVVRAAFDEGQRQAAARVLRQLADAVVEVVRLVEVAGLGRGLVRRPRASASSPTRVRRSRRIRSMAQ